jgi:hypothetical protein
LRVLGGSGVPGQAAVRPPRVSLPRAASPGRRARSRPTLERRQIRLHINVVKDELIPALIRSGRTLPSRSSRWCRGGCLAERTESAAPWVARCLAAQGLCTSCRAVSTASPGTCRWSSGAPTGSHLPGHHGGGGAGGVLPP